jgi:hypothetical protein
MQQAARQCALALLLLVVAGLRHHLVWGDSLHLRPLLDAFETACVVGFAWFGTRGWLAAIAAVRERTPGLRALVRASLPLLVLGVVAPPFLSSDVTDYVMRGRVLALHGGNPYVQVAADFPTDPFLVFGDAPWKQFPLPYGPLVADLQGALAWLGAQLPFLPLTAQFVWSVVLFKLVFALALLAAALVARDVHARLRGGDGDVAFVAVLWCPLVLEEALASAHNESLLLLAILLALRAAIVGRAGLAAFALGLGVLTKIVPVLLAPLFLVFALRARRVRAFALGALAAALLLAFYWWRFFAAPGGLDFLQRQSSVSNSSLVSATAHLTGADVATTLRLGRAIAIAVLVAAMIRLWRRPTGDELVRACAAVLAATIVFGLAGFGPWYHVWWAPLALLLGRGWLQRAAVHATWLSPLGYLLWTSMRRFDGPHEWLSLATGVLLPAALATALPWSTRGETARE